MYGKGTEARDFALYRIILPMRRAPANEERKIVKTKKRSESSIHMRNGGGTGKPKNPLSRLLLYTNMTGPGLAALGSSSEAQEAVRQLLEYAGHRAPGQTLTVRGEQDGEWAVLRIEDRGPTMSRKERRLILHPDGTPSDAGGDRGVLVAAKLLRAQGGDVWVEPRPGGGSSFGLCLPVGPETLAS